MGWILPIPPSPCEYCVLFLVVKFGAWRSEINVVLYILHIT